MPNAQGHRALVVVIAIALLAVMFALVNAHRVQFTPIVITPPGGAVNAAEVVPITSAAKGDMRPAVLVATPAVAAVATPKAAPLAPALIYVHVAGAVKHPSLYQLAPDSRVWHAIKAAGGPAANADENAVNLAAKIHDGEKIYVPTRTKAAPTIAMPKEAAEVIVAASAPRVPQTAHAPSSAKSKSGASIGAAGKPTKLVSASQGQVNINTADAEKLQELPGIGPAMAGRIVGYRQQAGGFQKAEDLMNVGGIGPKKFSRIAPLVKLH